MDRVFSVKICAIWSVGKSKFDNGQLNAITWFHYFTTVVLEGEDFSIGNIHYTQRRLRGCCILMYTIVQFMKNIDYQYI